MTRACQVDSIPHMSTVSRGSGTDRQSLICVSLACTRISNCDRCRSSGGTFYHLGNSSRHPPFVFVVGGERIRRSIDLTRNARIFLIPPPAIPQTSISVDGVSNGGGSGGSESGSDILVHLSLAEARDAAAAALKVQPTPPSPGLKHVGAKWSPTSMSDKMLVDQQQQLTIQRTSSTSVHSNGTLHGGNGYGSRPSSTTPRDYVSGTPGAHASAYSPHPNAHAEAYGLGIDLVDQVRNKFFFPTKQFHFFFLEFSSFFPSNL